MRSGTSLFDWMLFKKNITRFWPIWASYLTIWMFVMPVDLMMTKINLGSVSNYDITSTAAAHPWFALFFGCFAAMAVLSHLYAPRSANFFGTLPVRREGIFLTQYLSGLAFVVVPNLIVAACTAPIFAGQSGSFSAVLYWLITGCGVYFFFYTLAVLCGMFAGHLLALPVFYGVMNVLAYGVYGMADLLMSHFYRGYYTVNSWVMTAVEWLTPIYKLEEVGWRRRDVNALFVLLGRDWIILTAYVLCAVLMAAASLLLYKNRRLESAGDVVAVRIMRPVFKYGVAVCAGITLGYVTSAVLGEESLPYTIVIWTALGCFGAQMVLDKTFRVFKKWKGVLAVSAAMAALMAVMMFDLTGFDRWLPRLEDVEYVEVYGLGDPSGVYDSADWNTAALSEPRDIQKILDLHAIALKGEGSGDEVLNLTLTYRTKSGVHSRRYYFRLKSSEVNVPGSAAYILESLYADRELYWRLYGFDRLQSFLDSGGRPDYMAYSMYGSDPSESHIQNYSDQLKLWEAVKADFLDGLICVRHVGAEYNRSLCEIEIRWYDEAEGEDDVREYITIRLTPTDRTLRVLREIFPGEKFEAP